MTIALLPYVEKAVQQILAKFASQAAPGNIDDNLFQAASRCYEFVNAGGIDEAYVETELYRIATQAGHSAAATRSTMASARRKTAGKAARIPAPSNGHAAGTGRGYADLAAYAQAQGSDATTFVAAGWSDSQLYEYTYTTTKGDSATGLSATEPFPYDRIRRALRFETDAGPRWRLIDEDKPRPKYWHPPNSHTDATKIWYRLGEAIAMAAQAGYLVLCNGEASVVVAQAHGVPALCETGGGEKTTPSQLLQMLALLWPKDKPLIVALDGDGRGRQQALKKAKQYRQAGYADVRALDLGPGLDLADFCRLNGAQSAARLPQQPDMVAPAPAAAQPGQPIVTQSQAIVWRLAQLGYTFAYNLCGNVVECNGVPMDDDIAAEIRSRMRDAGEKLAPVEDAYRTHARLSASYHPIKDYLGGLVWDGVPRIGQLADHLRGDNPIVLYPDGTACRLENVYLHRWLVGAVAKVFAQAQNGVLVFAGGQGKGKSYFARWLCPRPLAERYFIEAAVDPHDKDSKLRMMSRFLWEVGELDATTRKADVSALKDFVSQKVVTVRRSYGRYDTTGPAMASLIGTVNTVDFLADDTGNRRFYVLDLQELDWNYTQLDVDQIWAEAVARYRAGEPWQLLAKEQAAQAAHNRQYLADGLMGDWLRRYFTVTHDSAHTLTAAEIVAVLRKVEPALPLSTNDRTLSMDISRACAALGVPKMRTSAGRFYVGLLERTF